MNKYYYIVDSNGRGDKDDNSKKFAREYSKDKIKIFYGAKQDKDKSYNLVTIWRDYPPVIDEKEHKDVTQVSENDIKSLTREGKKQYLVDAGFDSVSYLDDRMPGGI